MVNCDATKYGLPRDWKQFRKEADSSTGSEPNTGQDSRIAGEETSATARLAVAGQAIGLSRTRRDVARITRRFAQYRRKLVDRCARLRSSGAAHPGLAIGRLVASEHNAMPRCCAPAARGVCDTSGV